MTRLNSNKIHLNNKGYDFSTFIYTIMIIVYDPIKLQRQRERVMENTSVKYKMEKGKKRNLLNSETEKGKIWNGKSVPLGKSVRSWCDGSLDRSFIVDILSYFSFQPLLHDWCNKDRGMCYPVCGMAHKKHLSNRKE